MFKWLKRHKAGEEGTMICKDGVEHLAIFVNDRQAIQGLVALLEDKNLITWEEFVKKTQEMIKLDCKTNG